MQELSGQIEELQGEREKANQSEEQLREMQSKMEELALELETKRRIEHDLAELQKTMQEKDTELSHARRRSMELEMKIEADRVPEVEKETDAFGLRLGKYQSQYVEGYECPIPTALLKMKNYMYENGGLNLEGIFRLAPDQKEMRVVKEQVNDGTFEGCRSMSTMANLIGVWYRELPTPILSTLDPDEVVAATSEEAAWDLVETLGKQELTMLTWLLDIGVDVQANSAVNKMTPRNLSIVFAPNLFAMAEVSMEMDPEFTMKMMAQIKQFATFVELLIKHRISHNLS